MPLIDRYMARLMWRPLALCLVLAAMLLLLDRLRRLLNLVVDLHGPVRLVWTMLANTIPGYLSYGLTIGLLLTVLLTIRRLALQAELDVLRASGVSYFRLLRMPFVFAAGLALANLAIVGWVQPHARFANQHLEFELRAGAFGAAVHAREFVAVAQGAMMSADAIAPDRHGLIGIFLRAERPGKPRITVAARSAVVFASPDGNSLVLRLRQGTLVSEAPGGGAPRTLSFDSHDLRVPLPTTAAFRSRGTGRYQELTLSELFGKLRDGAPASVRAPVRAELHFRLAEVAAMLVLPLLALGLGVPPKRSTSALGLFLAVPVVVFWFKVNDYAAAMAAKGRIDAAVALWTPFLAMTLLGGWMVYRLDRTPGGQPIGGLEAGAALLRRGWRALRR
ncbi:LptF/LptG family permease [Sphingomonas aracearum]|uniref:LptF/LptG family permease n=1 Tax=Sphingomonas aracearum TaxID=2283317 RepID=A0A369VUW3_9SPHN|nr:LptF/LptG family permease [Sphingomonas aracearum]